MNSSATRTVADEAESRSGAARQTELGDVPTDWNVDRLSKTWDVVDCKHITADFVFAGIPVVSIREVQSRFVDISEAKQTNDAFYVRLIEGGRKPSPGDLILSRNATVGEVAQVADWHPPFAMGQDVCLLRKKSPDYSSDFLQSVLKSDIVASQLENVMIGSTFRRVNIQQIKALLVPTPPPPEQRAIAAALSDVDTFLEALEKLIAKKRAIKQAVMQQLLTGKTRLPAFSGTWETLPLGELEERGDIKLYRGNVVSQKDIDRRPGDYPIYSSSVHANGLFGYYGEYMFDEELITWSVDGGGHFFYRPKHRFSVTNVCGCLRIRTRSIHYRYFAYHLQELHSGKIFDYTLKAHPSVIRGAYQVALPCIEEQTAIATVLFDMDAEIVALERRRDKTRAVKQGMMQQLLTGRVRLVKPAPAVASV